MAKVIPNINSNSVKMTTGERRFGQRLEKLLEDDYLCWFDVPVGSSRRYPDFIVLHPSRGLLFLEVKDWKATTIESMSHQSFTLLTSNGKVKVANPVEQVRQCTYQLVNQLKRASDLTHAEGKHKGNLIFPYGYGVVLTNITRKQLDALLGEEGESILPPHLVICRDEMLENEDPETFQARLWGMFNYTFNQKLTLPQIDRIRGVIFPEIRITPHNRSLFDDLNDEAQPDVSLPDIIQVMDMQQEQLARGFGEGHRVIHGVAGSGKTLILGFRCWYLAKTQSKPILVLCYNVSLAAKLRAFIADKGIDQKVQVYHFHDWCGQQLKLFNVDVVAGEEPIWERHVLSVIKGVDEGLIPSAQYGAVLIDEGHDFEAEWLSLIVRMIDPETNSLLLLYDDAQSIYKKKSNLKFSLSSVGIQARGRTTILKLNYRNTQEILHFAYNFAKDYLQEKDADEDSVPLIKPQVAGKSGLQPAVRTLSNELEETHFIAKCLRKWNADGVAWSDMAVIYCHYRFADRLMKTFKIYGIPAYWMSDSKAKKNYQPQIDQVLVITRQSSKGLEFPRVIVSDIGSLTHTEESKADEARLLYVAMTRAKEYLVMTSSRNNPYVEQLKAINEESGVS